MASSRFPDKPLVPIMGLPMVEHVRRRAMLAKGIDEVVVATCDQVIMDAVLEAGGMAILTSDQHERATERVAEAMRSLTGDVVVVVQGDEPLLHPDDLQLVIQPFKERQDLSAVCLLSPLDGAEDVTNPNIVKAACDQEEFVMFFTRAEIPYPQKPGTGPVFRETGIRAFWADFLQTYIDLPETPLEHIESVDMLRLLEHGYRVIGAVTQNRTIGVDHEADVGMVEDVLKTDPVQRALLERILVENS
jgi:3-deoxy-manno-octulosonate cytidylyltransferase (CMP-KDO synthetase)